MKRTALALALGLWLLSACGSSQPQGALLPTVLPTPRVRQLPTLTAAPTAPSPSPTAGLTAPRVVCSPLEGFTRQQLLDAVANPYNPPPPGSDNPHEGVDLARLDPSSKAALAGGAVHSALVGSVAAVMQDRFPYGNALIIETPLDALPVDVLDSLQSPAQQPTPVEHSALNCPAYAPPAGWDGPRRSLYLVYAHLQAAPAFQAGETVSCGQQLGQVGQSGNALNPHLHFEVRVGPSGARFASMAHYNNSATAEEMSAYCLWRVSGWFELMTPLRLVNLVQP